MKRKKSKYKRKTLKKGLGIVVEIKGCDIEKILAESLGGPGPYELVECCGQLAVIRKRSGRYIREISISKVFLKVISSNHQV